MLDWLIFFVAFIGLQWLVWKLKLFKTDKLPAWSANLLLTAKVGAGIVLYLIYSYYYQNQETADIFKFFDDAKPFIALFMKTRRLA